MDYLVYSLSGSLEEEEKLWDADYAKIIKRMLFKQFDSYVERKYYERTHNNG